MIIVDVDGDDEAGGALAVWPMGVVDAWVVDMSKVTNVGLWAAREPRSRSALCETSLEARILVTRLDEAYLVAVRSRESSVRCLFHGRNSSTQRQRHVSARQHAKTADQYMRKGAIRLKNN